MPSDPNARIKLSPILGLPIYDEPLVATEAVPVPAHSIDFRYELSVIIPARDEEQNLPGCLQSLLAQNDKFFTLGTDWELIVVDDASTDRTAEIAREAAAQHTAITVLQTPPLDAQAFTGKTQACWVGAQSSRGRWLLFTDADTLHEAGDLIHSLHETKRHNASLLSYSPKQIVRGVVQHALMPLVFSELASVYPTAQVNDPASRTAAANGQFLLVEREAYFAVGGHKAVGASVLEDVDLAWNVKRSKRNLWFRYAPEALSTRMYRGLGDMIQGWTKNLALLFPHALALAAWRALDIALLLLPLLVFELTYLVVWQKAAIMILWLRNLWRFFSRVRRSNFSWMDCLVSPLALPLFIYLLVRSWMNHKLFHRVDWKGREYRTKQ